MSEKEFAWDNPEVIADGVREGTRTVEDLQKCGCKNCIKALKILRKR